MYLGCTPLNLKGFHSAALISPELFWAPKHPNVRRALDLSGVEIQGFHRIKVVCYLQHSRVRIQVGQREGLLFDLSPAASLAVRYAFWTIMFRALRVPVLH